MRQFTQLKLPETDEYNRLKQEVLSVDFPWFFNSHSTMTGAKNDLSFYSHVFLAGPVQPDYAFPDQKRYSQTKSQYIDSFDRVLDQIFDYNNMNVNCVFRMNANAVHPTQDSVLSEPHVDHYFPHKNLLIYLTDAGGETHVEGESFSPSEDDVVTFEGLHWMSPPKLKRRVVLVATYN